MARSQRGEWGRARTIGDVELVAQLRHLLGEPGRAAYDEHAADWRAGSSPLTHLADSDMQGALEAAIRRRAISFKVASTPCLDEARRRVDHRLPACPRGQ